MSFNYFACLDTLLAAHGWHGDKRAIIDAAPYLAHTLDLEGLRTLMANLNFGSYEKRLKKNKILPYEWTPCLFTYNNSDDVIFIQEIQSDDMVTIYRFNQKKWDTILLNDIQDGIVCHFYPEESNGNQRQMSWFHFVIKRFYLYFLKIMGVGFFSNLLALSAPLFTFAVYDLVIPTRSDKTLLFMILGMGIILFSLHLSHTIKSKMLAYLGARLEMITTTLAIKHLLFLPPQFVEGASVPSQISRIKNFDNIREVFTGPLAQSIVEIPYMFLFIGVLTWFAGTIALIPLFLLVIFGVMLAFSWPRVQESTRDVSSNHQNKRMFLLEAINRIHTIKSFGAHDIWLHRFHKLELKSAKAQNRSENITSFINNFSQTLIKVAGMIGILWGAIRVMDGNMSVGGMMVIVLLIWRALSPIQSLFLALSRIDHIVSGIQQLNNLMKLPTEPEPKTNEGQIALIMSNLEHVRVEQVAFRYPTQLRPSLAGIVMEAKPGEMVVIIGDNGSGKSTLLKLLLGFYPIPQGRIAYDNIDITQYNPILLRQAIGYAPQVCQFFHGSIAQNLRMSNPEATEQQMKLACEQAGVLKDIIKLPKKFETIMTDHSAHQFSSGFLHRLALARTYVKNSSLMILDEPGNTLDFDSNELLKDNLQKYHGDKTIIIASHRPSIVKLADRVLALQNGQMFAFGPRDKVLEALQGVKR